MPGTEDWAPLSESVDHSVTNLPTFMCRPAARLFQFFMNEYKEVDVRILF